MRTLFHYPLLMALWVFSRWLIVAEAYSSIWIFGDVAYYFTDLHKEQSGDIALKEYPEANLWILRPLSRLIDAQQWDYRGTFVAFILLLDAVFLLCLMFGQHWRGSWFWVIFGWASGPIFVSRLDLVPGMLVGLCALFLVTRPRVAAAILAAATMMKLWPGVLATVLVGPWKSRNTWWRIGTFGATALIMAGITVANKGIDRLLSPLDYQSVRGLQIESVAATPYMILASANPRDYKLTYAASKSFEITGPGVEVGVVVATWALYAVVALAAVEVLRRLLGRPWAPNEALALAAVIILGLLVSNKVLSPQYMMWLAPLVAVALSRSRCTWLNVLSVLLLATTWATWYVFPAHYGEIIDGTPDFMPTLMLALRNAMIIVMLGLSWMWWRWEASSQRREDASELVDVRESVERSQRNRDGSPVLEGAHRL